MTIYASAMAQEAAIAGLRGALYWRSAHVLETGAELDRFRSLMARAPGDFQLQGSGAFFGGSGTVRGILQRGGARRGEKKGPGPPSRVVPGGPGPCHARPIAAVLTKGSAR
ncbi:hypothetical protein ACFSNO_07230 [Streptomyces cirratus]|nr:hypothetical protein [Streptomyces cirratus]